MLLFIWGAAAHAAAAAAAQPPTLPPPVALAATRGRSLSSVSVSTKDDLVDALAGSATEVRLAAGTYLETRGGGVGSYGLGARATAA